MTNFIGLILRNGNLTKQVSHAILRNTKETGAESPQAKTIFHKLEIFYWCHLVDKRYCLVHVYYNVKTFGLTWGKAPYACLCITHLWMPYKAVQQEKTIAISSCTLCNEISIIFKNSIHNIERISICKIGKANKKFILTFVPS